MFENKRALLFDIDGTLLDSISVWNETDRRLYAALGGEYHRSCNQFREECLMRAAPGTDPYLFYCGELGKRFGSLLTPMQIMRLRADISAELLRTTVSYKPGAPEFLRAAKDAGLLLALTSTTRRANLEIHRTNERLCAEAAFDDYFSLMLAREDVSAGKPDKEIYVTALKMLDLTARECLVFEDSPAGIAAATAAGIDTAAICEPFYEADADAIREKVIAVFPDFYAVLDRFTSERKNGGA